MKRSWSTHVVAFATLMALAPAPGSAQRQTGSDAPTVHRDTNAHAVDTYAMNAHSVHVVSAAAEFAALPPGIGALPRSQTPEAPTWRPLRVAKYGTAITAAGAALYGLRENRRGDRLFDALEEACAAEPQRCTTRTPGGSYADPEMEQRYAAVQAHDRRARTALVAGQAAVAVSAVLFILDLRNVGPPPTIPYDPDRVSVGAARDGGVRLGITLPVRSP